MNLTRALDVALPDIPARAVSQRMPRLDPAATFAQHIEDGQPMIRVYLPAEGVMYKFDATQWKLIQLFDGVRTYPEIIQRMLEATGVSYDESQIREFAGDLETAGFWFKTPREKNVLYLLQTKEDRRKNAKAKHQWGDLSFIIFPAFNPDRFLTWFYSFTRFMYSAWFTVFSLAAFSITALISLAHWSEIGRDTIEFYNFSNKSWSDISVLYALGMFVVAVHEFGHAHACKHYGGRVPAMGFALIYLTPAFYTDTTEGAVLGSRYQRLIIALAGIWSELLLCSIATPIWWLTDPGTAVHDNAYFIMMLTGIISLLVNWNPLMKLDGYYMLCEAIGIPELKEDSTLYVSAWLKRHVWRLPVEVPYVPKSRRFGFVVYALLSGAYSYTVLYIVARFAGNVSRNFNPDWSFIPEYLVAALVFKSRIVLLVNFMKFLYLDKKDRFLTWLRSRRVLAVSVAVLLFLFLPLWHESAAGHFVLEPARLASVRASVPGVVESVFVNEGQSVPAGTMLATLRNLPLQSDLDAARAQHSLASSRATAAILRSQDYGPALQQRDSLAQRSHQLALQTAGLILVSPISGTVLTPRPTELLGSYLTEGADLVQVADLRQLRARIFVSEYDLHKFNIGSPARLHVDGSATILESHAAAITPVSQESDPRFLEASSLKGLNPPQFYVADLPLDNSSATLKPGMTGYARIYGRRVSLAQKLFQHTRMLLGRKLW